MKNEIRDENEIKRDKHINAMRIGQRAALLLAVTFLVGCVYFFRGNIAEWYAKMRSSQQLETMQQSTSFTRIKFEPDDNNLFALYGSNLVVLNKGSFKVYSPDSTELFSLNVGFSSPAMEVSRDFVAIYNRGGRDVMLADNSQLITSFTTAGNIISLSVNDNGYIVTVEEDELYRVCVNVYNSRQKAVYQWKTSDYYIMDAQISPDNKMLMVTGYTQAEGEFLSRTIFFYLNEQQYHATVDITGTIVLNSYFTGNNSVVLIGDDIAYAYTTDGERISSYEYGGDTLKTGAASEKYAVVSLTDRTTGLGAKLVALSGSSSQAKTAVTTDEIRSIAVCGDYVAVLYTQSIQLFDTDLNKCSDEVGVSQVKDILVNDSGLVMLIYTSDAGYVDLLSAFSGAVKEGEGS